MAVFTATVALCIFFIWNALALLTNVFSFKIVDTQISSLVELTAQAVARHIPFEVVEHFQPPVPEQLQLRIAFWSFPENEEDIR